ncbi:MAG: M23 family metallopeptidase [Nannocystaceae bacterium]
MPTRRRTRNRQIGIVSVIVSAALLTLSVGSDQALASSSIESSQLRQHMRDELSLLQSRQILGGIRASLVQTQRTLERAGATASYRGRQAARRLDAYQISAASRQEQADERGRALYKFARGGLLRLLFEDRALDAIASTPARRGPHESRSSTRLHGARTLRHIVAHDLSELAVYRRAQVEARNELVVASRQLAAHQALRSMAALQQQLVAAFDNELSVALAVRKASRRRASQRRPLSRDERVLWRRIVRARAKAEATTTTTVPLRILRPVPGDIVGVFGLYSDPILGVPIQRNGLEFSARAGERVRSPAEGEVVHVGDLDGYEQVVVVDHGAQYRSLVGHLLGVSVAVGDRIPRGATLGRPAPRRGNDELGRTIYYELRHAERPLDPRPLLQRR